MSAEGTAVGEVGADAIRSRQLWFYLIFFVGGMPALIYQVAWQRVLTLYFGVDIYSTSVIVATFMFGLGVGSLFGGWLADRVRKPVAYYAGIEILMGGFGFASLPLFSVVGQWLGGGPLATVVAVDFALLLVPTTLMGMTLPLMCRVVIGDTQSIGRHLSWLYGVNTFGAALGALLSAYLLIGIFGLDGATHLAAWLNIALALAVYVLAVTMGAEPATPKRGSQARALAEANPGSAGGRRLKYRWVLVFSFLSGFTALGYEIVWYRVLGIILHSTVYVFGTILFFFLSGIAVGSLLARTRIDRGGCIERFGLCQLGISAYAFVLFSLIGHLSWLPPMRQLIGASFFTTFHPSPELIAGHVDIYSLYSIADIGIWAILILGVPTILMGYGFTNLMREGARQVEQLGHAVGGMYFANILGSAIGSMTIGFLVIHYFGSEAALKLLIVLGSIVPLVIFARATRVPSYASGIAARSRRGLTYLAAVLMLATFVAFPGRTQIIRAVHFADYDAVDFIGAEDRTGVSVLRHQHEIIAFGQEAAILGESRLYIDGSHHGDASAAPFVEDWDVTVALAAHSAPRRVLSIGLGDGQMAVTAVQWPDVEELVVVELNGTLDRILRETSQGRAVLSSEKTTYVVDDGRRWLLANADERFDVILMFPLHAAHAYSGALYSLEFFRLLAQHLNEGGIVFLRTVDLYSTARTLVTAFPHVLRLDRSSYLAGMNAFRLNPERLPSSPEETIGRISADRDVILAHTGQARINLDLRPNSEYYVTYPFVSALQTRLRALDAYSVEDTGRFWSLIARRETEAE
jgi:spermidine synthase